MIPINRYPTIELLEIRKDLIKCAENNINVFGFSVADIDTELEFRASKRTLADDEQPDNPILDMGQSFIPKTAY